METERLIIRRFLKSDWRDLLEYLSDPEVVKYEPYETFGRRECIKEAKMRARDPSFLAVCLKESGKMIGNLYFHPVPPPELATWELGYVFNRRYHGQGYATEAARRLLEETFSKGGAHRVIAMCNPLNTASWRVMERIGMRREGHRLKNIFFRRGAGGEPVWQDTYEYAILAGEWKQAQADSRADVPQK